MMKFFNFKISLFIFIYIIDSIGKVNMANVIIGKSIIPNQCGSLGENNPLRLLDCSIFILNKGMCCLLTITKTKTEIDDESGFEYNEEYFETACIVLNKIDAKIINETTIQYKHLGGYVLIECSQFYINKYFMTIIFVFLLLF